MRLTVADCTYTVVTWRWEYFFFLISAAKSILTTQLMESKLDF